MESVVRIVLNCWVYLGYSCYSVRPFQEDVVRFHFNVSKSHWCQSSEKCINFSITLIMMKKMMPIIAMVKIDVQCFVGILGGVDFKPDNYC